MTDAQTHENAPEANPARGRAPRIDVKRRERRRRRAGTLNRMAQFTLDIFDPSQLDPNYVYRWVDDQGARLRMATKGDDYDYVEVGEIEGFDPESTDSESSARIRMLSGTDKHGNPTYTYLLRKPKEFFEDDMEDMVDLRQTVMDQRVYQGTEDGMDAGFFGAEDDETRQRLSGALEGAETEQSAFYVPKGNKLGGPSGRRRGPVTPNRE